MDLTLRSSRGIDPIARTARGIDPTIRNLSVTEFNVTEFRVKKGQVFYLSPPNLSIPPYFTQIPLYYKILYKIY